MEGEVSTLKIDINRLPHVPCMDRICPFISFFYRYSEEKHSTCKTEAFNAFVAQKVRPPKVSVRRAEKRLNMHRVFALIDELNLTTWRMSNFIPIADCRKILTLSQVPPLSILLCLCMLQTSLFSFDDPYHGNSYV